MKYDFDMVVDRHNTGALKWDLCDAYDGVEVLPMWVADMDFESPSEIRDAIKKRVRHGIFGYSPVSESYYEAVISWMKRRHDWNIRKDWIVSTHGVVPAVCLAILEFTQPGDRIIVQSPVYHPFFRIIRDNGRKVAENRLKPEHGRYVMDYQGLERLIDDNTRMLILCSPHNPAGRVWEEHELRRLMEICAEHDLLVVSDEIHSDLILEGHMHIPAASLSPEIAQNTITCTSASKTFNLAGLGCANIIIPNKDLFDRYRNLCGNLWLEKPNLFGLAATEAGYRHGEEWLEQLLVYIKANYDFLVSYMKEHLPMVYVFPLEGTYLAWMDFRNIGVPAGKQEDFLKRQAKVWLDDGRKFGSGGEGFQRINLACPRETLKEGLNRIAGAVLKGN